MTVGVTVGGGRCLAGSHGRVRPELERPGSHFALSPKGLGAHFDIYGSMERTKPRTSRTPVAGSMTARLDLPSVLKPRPATMALLPSDPQFNLPIVGILKQPRCDDSSIFAGSSSIALDSNQAVDKSHQPRPLRISLGGGYQGVKGSPADPQPRSIAYDFLPHSPHQLRYAIAVIPRVGMKAGASTDTTRFDVAYGSGSKGKARRSGEGFGVNGPLAICVRPRKPPPDYSGTLDQASVLPGCASPGSSPSLSAPVHSPYGQAVHSHHNSKAKRFSIEPPLQSPRLGIRKTLAATGRYRQTQISCAAYQRDSSASGYMVVNEWYARRKVKNQERDDRMRQQRLDEVQRVTVLQEVYNMKHATNADALKSRVQFQL